MPLPTPPTKYNAKVDHCPDAAPRVTGSAATSFPPELKAVQDLNRAREHGRRLVERWLVVAEALLTNPEKLSGKELNRAAELILAANAWIREELSRAKREHANATGTYRSYMCTPGNGGAQ